MTGVALVLAAAVALAVGWLVGSHFSQRSTTAALDAEQNARAENESRENARIAVDYDSSLAEARKTHDREAALARWRSALRRLSRP